MQRLIEIIFGLNKGFLHREGEFSLHFNPHWPGQEYVGAGLWNFVFVMLGLLLVFYVYRREGRSRGVRISLGILRILLIGLVLALLNRPTLTLTQTRTEPSVLAILVDESASMRIGDAANNSQTRLQSVIDLLTGDNRALLNSLAQKHTVRLYRFSQDAQPIGMYGKNDGVEMLSKIRPEGQNTQVISSIRTVLDDLQGQRLAGVVVLTDGRDTPYHPLAEELAALKNYAVKVYPVPIGSDRAPANIEIQSVSVQESAFKGDIVNVKAQVRATGYEAGRPVRFMLKDKKTGRPLYRPEGGAVEQVVHMPDDNPVEVELQFKAMQVGTLDLLVEAEKQPGEIDDDDNVRTAQIAVLDAKISVLYVDGYPRWEYRYIKNEMMRDKTVEISCLLTSADPTFAQEGNKPIKYFPETLSQLMEYDVIVFGDVDPRQFSDSQLQMISEFVARKGGGFGMVAGPRWSPQAYRNTAIEPLLPVNISRVVTEESGDSITQGFRPVLTREGVASSIFRFFADKEANEKYIKNDLMPVYWYCRGVTAKPGVGETYAEHPSDVGPDGRKAPILVLGRFGGGRTLFSSIDDSWRWRYYTGESVFDTYWVQQLRYLARSKKLGQQVRLSMRVLDPQILQQLPDQVGVEVMDSAGTLVKRENLLRQEGQMDLYIGSYTADRVGRFTAKLTSIAGGVDELRVPFEVSVPRLELAQPQVDRTALSRIASETFGQVVDYGQARVMLPSVIAGAAKIIPVETSEPLWDAPFVLILFSLLITLEWILRKMHGML